MQAHGGWNALFWCNHDQPRAVSRFGSDTTYWKESAEMLAAAIHFMRGTPYIYQGEELGMTNPHFTKIEQYRDVESLNYYRILREQDKTEAETLDIIAQRSRDDSRTPMQWNSSEMRASPLALRVLVWRTTTRPSTPLLRWMTRILCAAFTRCWCICARPTRSSARARSSFFTRTMPICWLTAAMVQKMGKNCWCCAT